MALFDTVHKKKAGAKTAVIMALLLLSFFYVGLTYLDPPPELGVEVNFGTMDTGSGKVETMQAVKTAPTPSAQQPEEQTQPEQADEHEPEAPKEPMMTQDDEDSPVTAPKENTKPKPKPKPQNNPVSKPKPPKPKPPKPKPSAGTTNALNNIINGPASDGTASQGEGDDKTGGNKGQISGTYYGNAYFGGGTGNGRGYGLNGRRRVKAVKIQPDCTEEGTVVVNISVNRSGKVIKASPNIKGSTTSAQCLVDKAITSAMATKFNPDSNAPEVQVGYIIFVFKVGG